MNNFERFRDVIWYNGEFVKPEDAKVSVMAYSMHYACGFFEGIRAYKTADGKVAIFRLEEHIERLIQSAKFYGLKFPFSKEELCQATIDVVKKNNFEGCYIRPLMFIGEGFNTISFSENLSKNIIIAAWELDKTPDTVTLSVSSYRRLMSSQVPMQAKATSNYMNSILIRNEAKEKGDSDGIALDMQGYVSEASTANLFLVRDGVIYTPDLSSSILNGLTRQSVITIAKNLGYEVVERKVARDELYMADEMFITGTASEVKVCTHVDKIQIGNGEYPISNRLASEFFKVARNENAENKELYKDWLTYVE